MTPADVLAGVKNWLEEDVVVDDDDDDECGKSINVVRSDGVKKFRRI
jgi:hypothetical protein